MRKYKCINNNIFNLGTNSLISIRDQDKFLILKWRNEQLYHLRQLKPLTESEQLDYFENVIEKLFDLDQPNQLLFSYLENGVCIGYGGLVHINWADKNAEISFIINTELEKDFFEFHWSQYLTLLQEIAFKNLRFHKIFTYAFDLRPHLYEVLLKNGFAEEAILKEHCFFEQKFIDVRIHSKINKNA